MNDQSASGALLSLTDQDSDSVRVPSSAVMAVEKFVPIGSLDPIYSDASYYLGPDGDAGGDVYAVLRDAIVASGKVALSHVVIARRERVVAIVPMGQGLVAHTLHEERDLNSAGDVFDRIPKAKSDPEMVKLATQLIDRQTRRRRRQRGDAPDQLSQGAPSWAASSAGHRRKRTWRP